MDTETRLICSCDDARELSRLLYNAMHEAPQKGEPVWVRVTLEQSTDRGPWRLIIGVMPPEEEQL